MGMHKKPGRAPGKKFSNKGRGAPKRGGDDRRTRWKFGQNFLVDPDAIRALCDDVPTAPGDSLIEIGPGQGALTSHFVQRCEKVVAVEIDPKWAEKLAAKSWENFSVEQADATRIDVSELLQKHFPEGQKPYLVGNLPYNRAAPILFHFLEHIERFQSFHFMVQYEVAKRICSAPGGRSFGFLSVAVQNRAVAEPGHKLGPECFRPRPKVMSATVKLTAREAPLCSDKWFLPFVDVAFSQRRKKLTNALSGTYSREVVVAALEAMGLSPDVRPEELGVEAFADLYRRLGAPTAIQKFESFQAAQAGEFVASENSEEGDDFEGEDEGEEENPDNENEGDPDS
jgi:16S rRNA (adenine1518-N6/adenine1519-N6)-dimethyltransferase